ncbi:hypothetical protein ACIA8C_28605 [Nocardia sp. NPDC051321]|uniref:hypothetical protein n=1 Tax=Nocardia sp. NPDC051321 TaxID=3364323 RepID=UPI0037A2ABC3
MAIVLNVPPTEDFTAFNALVARQGEHLGPMVDWTGKECMDTDGLDGLLAFIKPYVPEAAHFLGDKLRLCQTGMGTIKDKVTTVDRELRTEDERNASAIRALFPEELSGFPDISTVSGGANLGNFSDEAVTLKTPDPPKEFSQGVVGRLAGMKSGHEMIIANKAYKMVTGESLIDQLFKPLTGDWDRLMYLHDAYDTLGDACYTVTATLRKGSWKIGSEWKGDTATAFDSYMFRWTMGLGGIGDAAKEVAKACKDGYDTILTLVRAAVGAIDQLIDSAIKALAKEALEMVAGDAAIEVVGLGPEDPVADVVALGWTAYKMVKIYEKVRAVVRGVTTIVTIFNNIEQAAKQIPDAISKVTKSVGNFINDDQSLTDYVEQRGFEFEKNTGWDPILGAARIGMLPSAT